MSCSAGTGRGHADARPHRPGRPGPGHRRPHRARREDRGHKHFTPEVLDALHGGALFRTLLPRAYNGEEVTPAIFFMQEVIAAADGSGARASRAPAVPSPPPTWRPRPPGRMLGATRAPSSPGASAPAPPRSSPAATASAAPGVLRVATAMRPGWAATARSSRPTAPSARMPTERSTSVRMVRREKVRFHDVWNVVGLRGTNSDTYTFDDIFVPEGIRRLPRQRRGTQDRRAAVQVHHHQPLCLGLRWCLDGHRPRHARRLHRHGEDQDRRGDDQADAGERGDPERHRHCEAKLPAAPAPGWSRCWTRRIEPRRPPGEISMHDGRWCGWPPHSAIHRAKEVAEWAYHEAGASAIMTGGPFERRMRDIHASAQQVQGGRRIWKCAASISSGMNPSGRFF